MRRWSLRILLGLLALLVVVVIVVQVVLWTDFPRQLVLSQVQRQLGLKVEARSVATGWFGHTTLRDVTVTLPLEGESFLDMPTLQVRHTWLPMLLVGRPLRIRELELAGPELAVRQDPRTGRWNLQDVVELLARAAGKQQAGAGQTGARGVPALPAVVVHDAKVTVADRGGKTATLAGVDVTGRPDQTAPQLVYHYQLAADPYLKASGQLAPGGEWRHAVKFEGQRFNEVLEPWLGPVQPLTARGEWEGSYAANQVRGRLTLTDAQAMTFGAAGTIVAQVGKAAAAPVPAGVNVASVAAAAGPTTAPAAAGVTGGLAAIVRPQNLVVRTAQKLFPEFQVASGTVTYAGDTVRATNLEVSGLGGVAQVDGQWATNTNTADLTATWFELGQPGVGADVTHSGRFTGSLRTPFPGQPEVALSLTSTGEARNVGRWDAAMTVNGAGRNWAETDWTLTVSKLKWDGRPRAVDLADLTARVAVRGQSVELASVHLAHGGTVDGRGAMDLATRRWTLNLDGKGWPVPRLGESQFEFALAANGNFDPMPDGRPSYRIDVERLTGRSGEVNLTSSGFFDAALPKPLNLNLGVTHRQNLALGDDPANVIQGLLKSSAQVTGTLAPVDLNIGGTLHGENLTFKNRPLGDMQIAIEGGATANEAKIVSRELELLGGRWTLLAAWMRYPEKDAKEDLLRVRVNARQLPLHTLGEAALSRTDVDGAVDGSWTFELPSLDRRRLTGSGEFRADAVRVGDVFTADRADGTLLFRGRRIELTKLEATSGQGTASVTGHVDLANIRRPSLTLSTRDWPVVIEGANVATRPTTLGGAGATPAQAEAPTTSAPAEHGRAARASEGAPVTTAATGPATLPVPVATLPVPVATLPVPTATRPTTVPSNRTFLQVAADAKLELDLAAKSATGPVTAVTTVRIGEHDLGSVRLDAELRQRSVEVRTVTGAAFGGLFTGSGRANVDAPLTSSATFSWQNIDGAEVARLLPAVDGLGGKFGGQLKVAPSVDPRALGELRADLVLDSYGGTFRGAQVGDATLTGYAGTEKSGNPPADRLRFVLTDTGDDPSLIRVADGIVRVWGRISQRAGGETSAQLGLQLDRLDINQLVHAVDPKEEDEHVGRLSGNLTLVGPIHDPKRVFGTGNLQISEADLVNVPFIRELYAALRLGLGGRKPSGRGTFGIQLDNGRLDITNFRYFNRGADIYATIEAKDVWAGVDSPIEGSGAGTFRPLKDLKLPFLADVDDVFTVLQSSLSTVLISGTVGNQRARPATFAEIGGPLRALLVGEVQSSSGQ